MKKCKWYGKELEDVSWNYPLCCIQHLIDLREDMREKHAKATEELITDTTVGFGNTVHMDWETFDRVFVFDLPWYRRFLIWLFPRMYDLRDYP